MRVVCSKCGREGEYPPGMCRCDCGAEFFVADDAADRTLPPRDPHHVPDYDPDTDRTLPPRTSHNDTAKANEPFDPDKTVMNMRVRREYGELREGDVVLGRYELLERLGSGVMGVVFKCRDKVSHVEYAVKTVPSELARDADAMEEVRENFQLVYNLNHPNIAAVKFLDRDEYGAYFLIMEYAPGENLTQWIKRKWKAGGPEFGEVVKIIKQIASALDYAHGERILHRDVKPANVMIDDQGGVKVLDFGLASKVRNTMTALSVNPVNNTSGTPNYLAPEQFKGKYPTPASDQYALGVIAYQMLAGHLPFESDDLNMLHIIVAREKPDRLDGISDAANKCLQKVLAKDPKARYATCADFAAALEAAAKATTPRRTKSTPALSLPQWKPNPRVWWIAAAAVFVAALIVTVAVIASDSGGSSSSGGKRASEAAPAVVVESPKMKMILLPGDVKMELVKVEAGTFAMGSSPNEDWRLDDEKQHQVTLTRDFYIGQTEVTQAQYEAVMGNNPSYWHLKGDNLPVERVSWHDAMRFCEKLNETGKAPRGWKFTLPTEAQWEYAARGGNKSRGYKYSGSNNLGDVAWYRKNSGGTSPVASKKANELGLYDMNGNVCEWCLDWYEKGYASDPEFLTGNNGSERVIRGGNWDSQAHDCHSARRSRTSSHLHFQYLGFRLALVKAE